MRPAARDGAAPGWPGTDGRRCPGDHDDHHDDGDDDDDDDDDDDKWTKMSWGNTPLTKATSENLDILTRPREIPQSSPASPWKTPSIPPLLLGLTQYLNKVVSWQALQCQYLFFFLSLEIYLWYTAFIPRISCCILFFLINV